MTCWLKLWTDIRFDETMATLNHAEFRLWIHLLAWYKEAQRKGNSAEIPERGTEHLPYHRLYRKAITIQLGFKPCIAIKILRKFSEVGLIEITTETQEFIELSILKWEKRQESSSAHRVRNYRYRKRYSNANVTGILPQNVTPNVTREDIEEENTPKSPTGDDVIVEKIYMAYPRKAGGRDAGLRAIRKALKTISAEELLALTQEYADCPYVQTTDRQFIPGLPVWFNQRRWETDRDEWQQARGGDNETDLDAAINAWANQRTAARKAQDQAAGISDE